MLAQDSWTVTHSFGRQGDVATFYITDDFGVGGTPHVTPQMLQSIVFTEVLHQDGSVSGKVLFRGCIITPKLLPSALILNEWQLDCLDFTSYTDNIIVNGDFNTPTGAAPTIDAIVKTLVTQANIASLTVTNVQPAPTIARVQINYTTLSAALTKLARLASQSADYGWFIDYNFDLHFFSYAQAAAPTVTFTDHITAAPTVSNGFYADDSTFAYEWDGGSIRNSCIVRGANLQAVRTDRWTAQSGVTSWQLTFAIDSTVAPTLTVGGATTTVQIMTASTIVDSTVPYQIAQNVTGQWVLTSRTGANNVGATISLTYTYMTPIIVRVDNLASQAFYNSVMQMEVTDTSITSVSAATARGNAELQAFQWAQERVTFTSPENWPGHFNAGDTITFHTTRVPNSQTGYSSGGAGWSGIFLVVSNNYVGVQGNFRKYTATCTRVS